MGGARGAGSRQHRDLARPRAPGARARRRRVAGRAPARRGAGARRLPRPPGARPRHRRRDPPCARGHARAAQRDPPRRARPVRRHPAGLRGRALPLACRRRGAGDPARDGVDARPGRHGARAPLATAVGRPVPPRVDLHRARPRAAAQLPRPHACAATPAVARGAARRRTAAGPRVRHRTLKTWCDPEAVFVALYGDREHAVWLDSSRAEPGLARFSFMGAPDGPLGQVVRYDVATRALTVDRAGERSSCARACSTTASANSRACAPTPRSCRSTSPAASPATSATSSRPSAAARSCTARRCPTPRSCSATG